MSQTPVSAARARALRRLGWGGAVALLTLAVGLLVWRGPRLAAPAGPEVDRASLTLREGVYYALGTSNRFTGYLTEHYPNGVLQARTAVVDGRVHGLSEGYYTNGQRQVAEYFVAGVSHGVRQKWFPSGARLSTVRIEQGQLEGRFQRWHEGGALAEEIMLQHGQPEGVSRAYYSNGNLKAEAVMRAGKLESQKFYADGEGPVGAALRPGPPEQPGQ